MLKQSSLEKVLLLVKKFGGYFRTLRHLYLIRSSGLFDKDFYLKDNPDVANSGINAALHYLHHGGFEGRNPSPNFYSNWYLNTYPDVIASGMNPLVHFLKHGRAQGHESFPPAFKLERMYDYSKRTNCLIFEGPHEQTYLQRPKVVGNFYRELEEGYAVCPQPYISVLQDAKIFGGRSLVVVEEKILLSDEMVDFNTKEFGKTSFYAEVVDEDTVLLTRIKKSNLHVKEGVLLSCGHDENYFHWLVECLPKLLLVDSLQQFKEVPLLIPAGLHKNLMTALERININNRQLIIIEPEATCHVEKLIFPSDLSRIVDRYEGSPVFDRDIVLSHQWLTKISECLRSNVNFRQKSWRKLYLTRRKSYRMLTNWEELELLLLKYGFEIVELEGTSLDFQLELFSQTSMIIAPTGAALTNMLFCQPGTQVIILMSDHDASNYYFWTNLGAVNNLNITTIVGERVYKRTDYYSVHDDYIVDAELVLEVLGERHSPMNYSRYLHYKSLMTSIVERYSAWRQTSIHVTDLHELSGFLEYVENVLHLKIQRVRTHQAGGYWPITTGDRLYIRYLNKTLAEIRKMLGRPSIGSEELRVFINHLSQLLESVEFDHNPKLKAVFFVHERYTWPSLESVYKAFAANPDCEAQLVYVDFGHVNNDKSVDWFVEYKNMGLPVIHYKEYDLSKESPDLAFFLKPYDTVTKQFYIDEVNKVVRRSVYIPYFVNWMALKNIDFLIRYHFQLSMHEKAWKIFDAPDFILQSHVSFGARKGENVELIGHPRFDAIANLETRRARIPEIWKSKFANKFVVMWNTHSYIATENWSTFNSFGKLVLDYFRNNTHLALLWRPHPHFFNSLINNGIMTTEQVEEMVVLVKNSDSIILDQTPDYLSAFSVADALISDASSMLVEFLLTSRPVIYTFNESSSSIVHENLLPAFYHASAWEEVEQFLHMLMDGKDDKLLERTNIIENFMSHAGKDVGKLIMDKCIKDLMAEEIDSGKALLRTEKEPVRTEYISNSSSFTAL